MATVGDLVLVYQKDKPAFFARIEDISADSKVDWYQVKLLVLQVPLAEAVWILREPYMNGDTFTMNGISMRIEKVSGPRAPERQSPSAESRPGKDGATGDDKVISIFDRKKR